MFKNEGHVIREWIEHYIAEGIEHFYLIDNNSDDNYIEKIQDFIDKEIVEIIPEHENYKQSDDFNKFLSEKKNETTWMIVVDLDEFAYGKGQQSIKEVLQDGSVMKCPDDKEVGLVVLFWRMFGSSGFKKQPDFVIPNFVYRSRVPNEFNQIWTKTIVKTDAWLPPGEDCAGSNSGLHCSHINKTNYCMIFSNGTYVPTVRIHLPVTEEDYPSQRIRLNHYIVQSEEFYMKVKAKRGDAVTPGTPRTYDNFKREDINDILDEELKNKRKKKCEKKIVQSKKLKRKNK